MARSAFVLETSGGNYVTVQSPERIKLPPKGFDLVLVFGTDGLVGKTAPGTARSGNTARASPIGRFANLSG
jgi:hypothetical protein